MLLTAKSVSNLFFIAAPGVRSFAHNDTDLFAFPQVNVVFNCLASFVVSCYFVPRMFEYVSHVSYKPWVVFQEVAILHLMPGHISPTIGVTWPLGTNFERIQMRNMNVLFASIFLQNICEVKFEIDRKLGPGFVFWGHIPPNCPTAYKSLLIEPDLPLKILSEPKSLKTK